MPGPSDTNLLDKQSINKPSSSWASVAASTPYIHNLASETQYDSNGDSSDAQPFIEYQSSKKRRRQHSHQPTPVNNLGKSVDVSSKDRNTNHQGQRLLIGKMITAGSSKSAHRGIIAAKPLVKKAVYYIDNVDASVTIDDMHEFITNLSVQILSLFEAKPRRYNHSSSATPNSKAFRLCINDDHRDRLLVDTQWPAYVSISKWFFKSEKTAPHPANAVSKGNDYVAGVTAHLMDGISVPDAQADTDATIIMTDHSQSLTTAE